MLISLFICVAAFLILVWHSRSVGMTVGLPCAYLFALLLQHLPGGLSHLVGGHFFQDSSATEIGLRLTAIGTVCFVAGVVLAQRIKGKPLVHNDLHWVQRKNTKRFALFCLYGGWMGILASMILATTPSLGAMVGQATAIWILGIVIGLLAAVRKQDVLRITLWLGTLTVYPIYVLIGAGFLSFGSTSVFAVMAALCVMVKSQMRAYVGIGLFSLLCLVVFMSYFQNRDAIRGAVWGGRELQERVHQATTIITDIAWFDPANERQLYALDQRLNQNFFVGEAAKKLAAGQVEYLHGISVWEGIQAMVPRALWPGKPIFAGTSAFIRKFTYFEVLEGASFGVGQVMEFYINFAETGVIVGFLLFGFAYGWIDSMAAAALRSHDFGQAIIWFLPGIGMLAPLASVAEVMGSIAAALVGAYAWHLLWNSYGVQKPRKRRKRELLPRMPKQSKREDEVEVKPMNDAPVFPGSVADRE